MPDQIDMILHDVILRWDATPAQLRAVGAALWSWCHRVEADGDIFQAIDNQALADLIAGKLPTVTGRWSDARGIHVHILCAATPDGEATIGRLRRELPSTGVADVLVEGASWNRVDAACPPGMTFEVTKPTPMRDHHGTVIPTQSSEHDRAG
jgi:hypothetical protein